MPIYEFYCPDCHRLFNFLSRRVDTERRPACPRCGRRELFRQVSAFAISKGRKEPASGAEPALPGVDEGRLERAMESLASDADSLDEDDPRQGARLMRRLFDAAGLPVGAPMEEALRRMESGESPEKIEEEMGDVLGDPLAGAEGEGTEPAKGQASLRRRLRPPTVDTELYEM